MSTLKVLLALMAALAVAATDLDRPSFQSLFTTGSPESDDVESLGFNFATATTRYPVILGPGIGGSALEAKLDRTSVPNASCPKQKDWARIYFNSKELLKQECWGANMVLEYNAKTNNYSEPQGVQMRVVDFGGVHGIDYLDYQLGLPDPISAYWSTFIKTLKNAGYVVGKNIRGAPYDWRLPLNGAQGTYYNAALKKLIEDTATANGLPVFIIGHSMGGLNTLMFLNQMNSAWKAKYIKGYITLSTPWLGASKAIRATLSGDNFDIPVLSISLMAKVTHSYGSVPFLYPDNKAYASTTLVTRNGVSYSGAEIAKLLIDSNNTTPLNIYGHTKGTLQELAAPGVPMWCWYGTGLQTEESYAYGNRWLDGPTHKHYADGDGTVPIKSALGCEKWKSQTTQPLDVRGFANTDHMAIVKSKTVIQDILDIITN